MLPVPTTGGIFWRWEDGWKAKKKTKSMDMEKEELRKLTDEELLAKKKEWNKSKIFHATFIGILAGILIFGGVAWVLSPNKRMGALIPMLIPVVIIYRLLKNSNKDRGLKEVLKERGLD